MRSPAMALVACALGCSAAKAPQPTSAHAADDAPAQPTESRLARVLAGAAASGRRMARIVVPIRDIPRVEVPPMLDPALMQDSELADAPLEQVMTLGFAEVRGFSWAVPWHKGDYDPVYLACGETRKPLQAVRAEGPLRAGAKGDKLVYAVVDRVYDTELCRSRGAPRITHHELVEILPSVVYAFRSCDDACADGGEVSLILPPALEISTSRSRATDPRNEARSAFSRTTLPLRRGGSETLVARIAAFELEAWVNATAPGEAPPPEIDLVVGVEISQSQREDEPLLLVYVAQAAPSAPPSRP